MGKIIGLIPKPERAPTHAVEPAPPVDIITQSEAPANEEPGQGAEPVPAAENGQPKPKKPARAKSK